MELRATVKFTVYNGQNCCQLSTVNFTVIFLQCVPDAAAAAADDDDDDDNDD